VNVVGLRRVTYHVPRIIWHVARGGASTCHVSDATCHVALDTWCGVRAVWAVMSEHVGHATSSRMVSVTNISQMI